MTLHRLRFASLVAVFAPMLAPSGRAEAHPGRGEHKGKIYIVGTVHGPVQLRSLRMSPGHVRAALEALDPDVVCVESNAAWFAEGRFYLTTYEAFGVALPWARERGRPVYGVDWLGRPADGGESEWYRKRHAGASEEGERLLALAAPDPQDFLYGLDRWLEPPSGFDLDASFAFHLINGDAWLPRDPETGKPPDWGAMDFEFATLGAFTHERDRHIARFVDRVVEEHPDARIAVIFGAGHRGRLGWFLRERGLDVETIDAVFERYPPDDVDRFEALLTPRDAAAILAEAWDSTSEAYGITARRAAYLLERLRSSSDPYDALLNDYLTAREAMLRGRPEDAASRFERIASSGGAHAFPYSGNEWRLYLTVEQAARLELGRIADLAGRRDEALRSYRALLESIEVPEASDDYQDGARFRSLARAHTATRALIRLPYRTVHDLASDSGLTAASLVRIAARANNVGEWELALTSVRRALDAGGLERGALVDAAFARANALVRLGRLAEAEPAMEKLRELYDSTPSGHGVDRGMLTGLQSELESLRAELN
jgi:tetratricopeptide (TPR) repeat protein